MSEAHHGDRPLTLRASLVVGALCTVIATLIGWLASETANTIRQHDHRIARSEGDIAILRDRMNRQDAAISKQLDQIHAALLRLSEKR